MLSEVSQAETNHMTSLLWNQKAKSMNKLTGTENKLTGARCGVSGETGEKGEGVEKRELAATETVMGV